MISEMVWKGDQIQQRRHVWNPTHVEKVKEPRVNWQMPEGDNRTELEEQA